MALVHLNTIKIIYTDVDGTFLNNGCLFRNRRSFSLNNALAIYHLLNQNVDVVMTSGREREKLNETARLLGFKNYIANLGMELVYNQGEKVVTNYGPRAKSAGDLKQWMEKSGVLNNILSHFKGRLKPYSPWFEILRTHFLLIGEADYLELKEWVTVNYPELKIIDNGEVPPWGNFVKPHAFHLLPKEVGKREAVRMDKKLRGLKTGELIGIGDSAEDLSIAPEVGLFFLLDPNIKTDAPNVIVMDNPDGEAFYRVVERLAKEGYLPSLQT
ncbi:MAG: hypothetical protein Kow0037_22470 [Calditrichia bacterium]